MIRSYPQVIITLNHILKLLYKHPLTIHIIELYLDFLIIRVGRHRQSEERMEWIRIGADQSIRFCIL